jgi:peptidoglycan/xylan/chitin deacetylase (PgdA/CDA1 family)
MTPLRDEPTGVLTPREDGALPGAEAPPFAAMRFLEEIAAEPPRSWKINVYYRIKPLLPRGLQIGLRRVYARYQGRRAGSWPIEPLIAQRLQNHFRAALEASGAERLAFVNLWPDRKRFAYVLTHDVEGPAGVRNIPRLLEIERRFGMVSCWNFVAEDYPIDREVFSSLRDAGCEIGLHGVHHDGLLFSDRASFDRQLPAIRRYLEDWRAVGFRSPATHRNAEWMPALACLYDSSFPDADPFEPQPGGCYSIWPYFLGDLVELPITMPQDHTLFEILREPSIRLWVEKADWIRRNHGLVNVIVHQDYMLSEDRLEHYEGLLAHLIAQPDGWHALPRDVAEWWRVRAALEDGGEVATDQGRASALAARATTAYARKEGDEVVFEV